MRDNLPLTLIAVFASFSLVSIGGGTSVMAGIQHQAVDVQHWMTERDFVDLFAISRAAPGPGSMLTTLIGWHVMGWTGAILATLALFLPSSLLCYGVMHVWNRNRGKRWHTALEQGLSPIAIGLILAGVVSLLRVNGGGMLSWIVAAASAAALTWWPRLHPLLAFFIGAAIFVVVRATNIV
jgi:chromate transporter